MRFATRKLSIGSVMAVLAAVIAVAAPSQVAATTPAEGCNAIAWHGDDGVTTQIYRAAAADGSGRLEVSTVGGDPDPTANIAPAWSPDGGSIAWSGIDDGAIRQIYVADNDGTSRGDISSVDVDPDPDPTDNNTPRWSPDGTGVVWSGDDGATTQIWTADADGADRVIVSSAAGGDDPADNLEPQWSPDDVRFTWSGDNGTTEVIWISQLDGVPRNEISGVTGGFDPTDNLDPDWSPDGTMIAWSGVDVDAVRQIYVSAFNGADRDLISTVDDGSTDPTDNLDPDWSPDGTMVAWSGVDAGAVRQIYVSAADGTGRTLISTVDDGSTDPTDNRAPVWSPDGSQIAWSGDDGLTTQIYVADADGTTRYTVSDAELLPPIANLLADWSPNPADLSVMVVVDNDTPELGEEIEATITVSNDGPCDATDVMRDGLDLTCIDELTGDPSPIVDGAMAVGDIADEAMVVVTATGTITDPAACMTDVVVSSYTPDVDPVDDTAPLALTPTCSSADLGVTVVPDDLTPVVTTDLVLFITVSNEGPCDVTDAEVSGVSLPCTGAFTGVLATVTAGTADVGSVPADGETNFAATATVTTPGPCAGLLTVSSSLADDDPSDDTAPVAVTGSGCGLTVAATPTDPNPGLNTPFEAVVEVTNIGGCNAADVEVAGLALPCSTALSGSPVAVAGGTADFGAVSAGSTESTTVSGTVTDTGACSTDLTLSTSTPDVDVDDGELSIAPGLCDDDPIPLTDVGATSFALADVICIYWLGITTGTSPTTYSPDDFTTREQMAAFLARLYRALGGDCGTGVIPFTDVDATSFALADIICIYLLGVTTGTSATTYSPDDFTTREQMAAFLGRLYRALGGECETDTIPFTDVDSSSFAFLDIICIYLLGVTTGTSATTYSPDDFTTREQMAAFLARLWRVLAV